MSAKKVATTFDRDAFVDIASRAAKTFVQTLTAQLLVGDIITGDVAKVNAALVAAIAACISVLWNAANEWANS